MSACPSVSAIFRIYTERHHVSSPTWRTRSKRRPDYTDPSQLATTVFATPNEREYEEIATSLVARGADNSIYYLITIGKFYAHYVINREFNKVNTVISLVSFSCSGTKMSGTIWFGAMGGTHV
jgi:hypothetical protein